MLKQFHCIMACNYSVQYRYTAQRGNEVWICKWYVPCHEEKEEEEKNNTENNRHQVGTEVLLQLYKMQSKTRRCLDMNRATAYYLTTSPEREKSLSRRKQATRVV